MRRVTVVTGASAGIGRELALLAAPDSRVLVLVARRKERLEELAGQIGSAPGAPETVVVAADLGDAAGRRALAGELAGRALAVDHLINNAGFGVAGRFHDIDPDAERGMVALNAAGLHDLLVTFLPGMAARGYGRVLNVASTAAFQPLPGMATYAATKAFVLALSEALWHEYRGSGVAVTCLCPGKTATEFFDDANMDTIRFAKMPATSPRGVARAGYRGMIAGQRVVIPGLQNKIGAMFAQVAPRRLVLAISGNLFGPRSG